MEKSTCTYPHKSVYLSDPFPVGDATGAIANYI